MEYDVIELIRELAVRTTTEAVFPGEARWSTTLPEDLPLAWRIEWEERAAIMEYDGGLSRDRAEALALAEVVARMEKEG